MKSFVCAAIAVALMAVNPGFAAPTVNSAGVPVQMVITVRPVQSSATAEPLETSGLTVLEDSTRVPVTRLERMVGDMAGMQLFVLLDDSTRSSSLGMHLPELKTFLESLPATTQVAVGYMRNGLLPPAEGFTTDHHQAAGALRPPLASPGANGSPYFALSELVEHWPSQQPAERRAVLMLTEGVDPYYGAAMEEDPYADAAIHEALKEGVAVYSIYLRGAGLYGRSDWVTNVAQSRLLQVGQATGGYAYFEDFTDPVTIAPFLNDLQDRLKNQYRVTIAALDKTGLQPVKLHSELRGLKIEGPTEIYVP